MNVYEIQGGFGIERVKAAECPVPVSGPREVLIKMLAVSLNARDSLSIS